MASVAPVANSARDIDLSGVSYRSGSKNILRDIDLKIDKGDFITIIGPNGAGKSTLIKIMMGVLKPTTGKLSIRKNLKKAYMPQRFHVPAVFPMSVQEFLKLGTNAKTPAINSVCERFGAERLTTRQMHSLSGGETQKILLARAYLMSPDVMLLDEPVQNLDIRSQQQMYRHLAEIHRELGCAVILISHDLHFVMSQSENVICLYGHICCRGKPEKISKDTAYLNIFGSEMENMAVYNHHHRHTHWDQ